MLFDARSRCSLELSEWILTKHRNPKETGRGMASVSLKDTSSSGVLTEPLRLESRPCSVFDYLVYKGVILTTWF